MSPNGHTDVRTVEIPAPEPDLTPEAVAGRARALIPVIRDQQDEAERLGHHTPELDRQFAAAGFYRVLQPRRFGGYEFSLPTFWQVMLAVSAGDPGTGWGAPRRGTGPTWTPRRPASPCTATRCTAAGSTGCTTRAWSSR